jgi:glycosyltransferase involved in cell wall biosynthesis
VIGAVAAVYAVLPNDIDDPATPSGGNLYDRRLLTGLTALGWSVREIAVPGGWPTPAAGELAALAAALASIPDGGTVLVDGLVGSAAAEVLVPAGTRLRLVLLVHLPLDTHGEAAVLAAARAVVTTSPWTRLPVPVHVATPGVDPAPLATPSPAGDRLLCVGAVAAHKGQDRLTDALAAVSEPFTCTYVGSLSREPGFVAALRRRLDDRIRLAGTLTGPELAAAYAQADLLLSASRGETYGMVATEALARGIPVLAVRVGGLPVALGHAPDGSVPGLLVEPDELAGAVRRWLGDADLRERLRRSARARRETLTGWDVTARIVSDVLAAA